MANVNVSKFMGASFAAGNTLEKRVGNNERKITLLKNIVGGRKDGQSIGEKIRGGSSLDQSIQNITDTVTNISETLKNRHQWEKEQAKKEGIELEQAQRDKAEKGSEAKAFTALKETSQKVLAPVKSIFDRILDVIKKLILGKIAMNIFDWFNNPENQGKVKSIIRFFKDFWPVLLTAYLLFGSAFGRMTVGLVRVVGGFAINLTKKIIPKLLAGLARMKMGGLTRMLGGRWGKGLMTATAIATPMIVDHMSQGNPPFGGGDGGGDGAINQNQETQEFSTGGFVSGPAGVDRVPAKLTAGEFVMSKGAVQKYGANTLAGMNAAAGGTNRPTDGGGYQGGGLVEKFKLQYPNLSNDQIQEVIHRQKNIMNTPVDSNEGVLTPKPFVDSRSLSERVGDALNVDYGSSSTSVDIDLPGLQVSGPQGPQGPAGVQVESKAWWDPLGVFTGKKQVSPKLSSTGANNEVGPPVKKTTTTTLAAMKADASKMGGASGGGVGTKIPNFNPAEKISENKIRTLGISV